MNDAISQHSDDLAADSADVADATTDAAEPAAEADIQSSVADQSAEAEPAAAEDEISRAQAHALALRTLEAVLFASSEPMDTKELAKRLPAGSDVAALLGELSTLYANRGINLVQVAGKYAFRTAPDLGNVLQIEVAVPRKLSRAAIETLSIIAYHQPVTRAEIEEIRGVALSRGTLDTLMETGWIQPKGHRETPGHPATWVTTDAFLSHFGLNSTKDLPGLEELKAAGLLDTRPAVSAYSEQGKLGQPEAADENDEERLEVQVLEPEEGAAEGAQPGDEEPRAE